MKTVAVVCEYNPFHMGHAHQIREIRDEFGEDCAVIAIMSGNYVQRGEPAILGKFERARAATLAGASLVLELPFPYSAASSEYFANAAVEIADRLGTVDVLSFGSECGRMDTLQAICDQLSSRDFQAYFKKRLLSKDEKEKGYAQLLSESFSAFFNADLSEFVSLPNNILAISYLSAIKARNSNILPHTILRHGNDKDSASDTCFAGATHLRSLLLEDQTDTALVHIPMQTRPLWQEALAKGYAPASIHRLSALFLAHLRLADAAKASSYAECGGGVFRLLKKAAASATDYQSLIALAATKKYTDARLRRALLFSYFGVTPASIKSPPLYTQVLAMDEKGKAVLAHIRKSTQISILTKPADLHKLTPAARTQAMCSYRADSIYTLACPIPLAGDTFLRSSPFCK